MSQAPDKDWLPFHPDPSIPEFAVPAGAVDAHCHVFGPSHLFPYAPTRKYTPCDAPKEKLWALRERLGFARNVIVQAACHGADNRALTDALRHARGCARGVAVVNPDISMEELRELDAAGVRAVRFNFLKRLVDALPRASLRRVAERVAALGWHIVIYFEAPDLPDLYDFFTALPTLVVVDHIGRPDVSKDPEGEEFQLFLQLLQEHGNFWSKVSCPERLSNSGPPGYDDVVPFARRVVEAFPERVLWGTDWPHPNMKSHIPDDGKLVDFIPRIAVTPELQHKLLVDNPLRLYWPELG
ncbi:MAG: amidohydrolase family protein [Gammaproteobacteria bacterium]|nr:amidohydrolase family protein [Gammaproteobacteria bacterium]